MCTNTLDKQKFCGDTITGLSLLSDAVMRLALEKDPNQYVDVLLKRRSLYIMRWVWEQCSLRPLRGATITKIVWHCGLFLSSSSSRGDARYLFTHAVLEDKASYFNGQHIPRDRRISVICRNEPTTTDDEPNTGGWKQCGTKQMCRAYFILIIIVEYAIVEIGNVE